MAAIGEDLAAQLAPQQLERALGAALVVEPAQAGIGDPADRDQPAQPLAAASDDAGEMAELARERGEDARAQLVVLSAGDELGVRQPAGDAPSGDLGKSRNECDLAALP